MNVGPNNDRRCSEGTRKQYVTPVLTEYGDIRIITNTLNRTVSAPDGAGSRTTA